MRRALWWLSGLGLLVAAVRAYQQLREFAEAERATYVTNDCVAAALATQRVRESDLMTPTADPETVRRMRERWDTAEAARQPKFLRGNFGRQGH